MMRVTSYTLLFVLLIVLLATAARAQTISIGAGGEGSGTANALVNTYAPQAAGSLLLLKIWLVGGTVKSVADTNNCTWNKDRFRNFNGRDLEIWSCLAAPSATTEQVSVTATAGTTSTFAEVSEVKCGGCSWSRASGLIASSILPQRVLSPAGTYVVLPPSKLAVTMMDNFNGNPFATGP